MLLISAAALVAALPASSLPATAAKKNYALACAPPTEAAVEAWRKSRQAAAKAAASKPATHGASATAKPAAKNSDDDDDDDDAEDAKDFPPLKPGESSHLIAFAIDGSKHIDEDALIATLPEHVGDPITNEQVKVDTDKIKKELTALHVHFAEVTTGLVQRAGPDHCVWVIWDIQHIDAFSHLPFQGFWKFGGQTFSGNKSLTSEQLEKAIGLKPDERVREGSISDAITGMQQAYDKVFPGQTVKVEGKLKLTLKPERVANFEWQIDEPAPAK
jgi:hypothetical protein